MAPACGYEAAAADLQTDSKVKRIVPVYMTASDSVEFIVQDLVVVKWRDDLSLDSALSLLDAYGLRLRDSSQYKHNLWRCALKDTNLASPLDVGNTMHSLAETEWACTDVMADCALTSTPSDSLYPYQYYLNNTGQTGGTAGIVIGAATAWDVVLQDSGLVVAVVDDGLLYHYDLPASRILPGFDAAGYDATLIEYDFDPVPGYTHGHGMACAGILGASHNDTGVVGVMGSCKIVPVKIVEDSSRGRFAHGYDIAQAIYFAAAAGAKVISNSWSMGSAEGWEYVRDAIRDAVIPNPPWRTSGCVVVFSAGNSGLIPKHQRVLFPANMPEVIAVGAVDKYGERWDYSSYGSALNVVAPAGDYGGVVSRPGDMWTADQTGEPGLNPPKFFGTWIDSEDRDYTKLFGGTSGAAPQVAGIAGLILARRPDFYTQTVHFQYRDTLNRVIANIIDSSAIDISEPGYDTLTGHGIVNAYRALLSVIRGDVDNDGDIDSADQAALIDMVFFGGHATLDDRTGDLDCDGDVDSLDLGVMIDHVFLGGPQPGICFAF